jgi:hypothetical protein
MLLWDILCSVWGILCCVWGILCYSGTFYVVSGAFYVTLGHSMLCSRGFMSVWSSCLSLVLLLQAVAFGVNTYLQREIGFILEVVILLDGLPSLDEGALFVLLQY